MVEQVNVIRWPHPGPPDEHTLRGILAQEDLSPYVWANSPGDTYEAHRHDDHKVIYVISGSIEFGLPEQGRSVSLQPGDRLELPAGVLHEAVVGPHGVSCLEAHRPR